MTSTAHLDPQHTQHQAVLLREQANDPLCSPGYPKPLLTQAERVPAQPCHVLVSFTTHPHDSIETTACAVPLQHCQARGAPQPTQREVAYRPPCLLGAPQAHTKPPLSVSVLQNAFKRQKERQTGQ